MNKIYFIAGKRKAGTTALYNSISGVKKPSSKDQSWSNLAQSAQRLINSDDPVGVIAKADALLDFSSFSRFLEGILSRIDLEIVFIDRNQNDRKKSFIAHERKLKLKNKTIDYYKLAFNREEEMYELNLRKLKRLFPGVKINIFYYEKLRDIKLDGVDYVLSQKEYNSRGISLPFFRVIDLYMQSSIKRYLHHGPFILMAKKFYYKYLSKRTSRFDFINLRIYGSVVGPSDGQRLLTKKYLHNTKYNSKLVDFGRHRVIPVVILFQFLQEIFIRFFVTVDCNYLAISRTNYGFARDLLLLLPAIILSERVVVHVHGADFSDFFNCPNYFQMYLLQNINLFVFLDQSLVPSYFEGTDFPYVVVKNPYDKSLLTVDPSVCKNYTLGLICKFVPGKGIEEFVRVSNERHDQFNFVLAGGPSEPRDPYGKNILKSLDYDRINYLGYLDDVSKFYSKADFLLFSTSYSSEAFPGVVVESMAAGVVPIVKRHNSLVAVFSGAPIVWFSTPEELSIRLNDIYKWDFDTLISKSQCCKKWITNNLTDVNGWSVQLDSIIEDVLFTD